jgi:hypothetical protein
MIVQLAQVCEHDKLLRQMVKSAQEVFDEACEAALTAGTISDADVDAVTDLLADLGVGSRTALKRFASMIPPLRREADVGACRQVLREISTGGPARQQIERAAEAMGAASPPRIARLLASAVSASISSSLAAFSGQALPVVRTPSAEMVEAAQQEIESAARLREKLASGAKLSARERRVVEEDTPRARWRRAFQAARSFSKAEAAGEKAAAEAAAAEEEDEDEEEARCTICCDRLRSVRFRPCHHSLTCVNCTVRLIGYSRNRRLACPSCSTLVTHIDDSEATSSPPRPRRMRTFEQPQAGEESGGLSISAYLDKLRVDAGVVESTALRAARAAWTNASLHLHDAVLANDLALARQQYAELTVAIVSRRGSLTTAGTPL